MSRPSTVDTLIEIASTVAKRSTCSRRSNGAVIATSNGVVLSTGYNGSLSGQPHCTHECDCEDEFIVERLIGYSEKVDNRPLHSESCPAHPNNGCTISVHAESNAVYFAARNGVSVEGADIYCTTEPCQRCAEAIVQSGIRRTFYHEGYRTHAGLDLLHKAGIEVVQV